MSGVEADYELEEEEVKEAERLNHRQDKKNKERINDRRQKNESQANILSIGNMNSLETPSQSNPSRLGIMSLGSGTQKILIDFPKDP